MEPKPIKLHSLDSLLAQRHEKEIKYPAQPLTDELKAKLARPNEDVLVIWIANAGCPPENRLTVKKIIGGAIGVSKSVEGSIVFIVEHEDPTYLMCAWETDGTGMMPFGLSNTWAEAYKNAQPGEIFTWRKLKRRKATIAELLPIIKGKVFLFQSLGDRDV